MKNSSTSISTAINNLADPSTPLPTGTGNRVLDHTIERLRVDMPDEDIKELLSIIVASVKPEVAS